MEQSPSTPCKHRIALVELAHRFVRTFCDVAFVPYELTAEAKRPSSGQYFRLIASHVPSLSDEVVDAELVHFRRTDYLDGHLPDINRFFESDSHLFSELCSAINSSCFDQMMADFQKLDASFVIKAQFITEDSFHRDLLEESVCVVSGALKWTPFFGQS